jgi:signal transduction histidine kinase
MKMKKLYLLIFYLVIPITACYSPKTKADSLPAVNGYSLIKNLVLPRSVKPIASPLQAYNQQAFNKELFDLEQKRAAYEQWLYIALGVICILITTLSILLYNRQRIFISKDQELIRKTQEVINTQEQINQANEELKAINTNLEGIVEERTLKLSKVNRELDMFLYRSSHDLRRPVTTLMGLVEVAKLGYDESSAKYLFSKVNDTAVNMDNMLEKFFMINTINHDSANYSEVNFQEVLDQIQHSHVVQTYANQVSINITVDSVSQFISDQQLITFIIKNLVDNALVFRSKDRQPFVDIQVQAHNNSVVLQIQDNGIGIPEAYLPEIFTIFYRGSEASKGNGMGLYVVRKAIDKLRGEIKVTSKVGEFTCFTITIPPVLVTQRSMEDQQRVQSAGA